MAEIRQALRDAITADDLADVARALKDLALGGDVQAARVLLEYCAGKPREDEGEDNGPLYKVYIGIDEAKV